MFTVFAAVPAAEVAEDEGLLLPLLPQAASAIPARMAAVSAALRRSRRSPIGTGCTGRLLLLTHWLVG
jgi:hypothetical protein